MVEIEITNYESIAHEKIIIEGFTTLIGRNYLGKSSTIRAINAALTNKEGTKFIRWGETFCEVRIKTGDLDVLWHKEDKNSFYDINGKKYPKIGKGDPPAEILNAGFKPITLDNQKINLNYAQQFEALFLVNKIDSKTADILTSVYGLDRIYKAIDLCNKEQKTNSNLLRIREKDLQLIEHSLDRFKDFPEIIKKIPIIKENKKKIDEDKKNILKIQNWKDSIETLFKENKRLNPIQDLKLPTNKKIKEEIREYVKIKKHKEEVKLLEDYITKVCTIELVNLPQEYISKIKQLILEYKKIVTWKNTYDQINKELEQLEKVKNISLPSCNIDLKENEKIQDMFNQLKTFAREIKDTSSIIKSLDEKIIIKEKELKAFNICPLCGATRG